MASYRAAPFANRCLRWRYSLQACRRQRGIYTGQIVLQELPEALECLVGDAAFFLQCSDCAGGWFKVCKLECRQLACQSAIGREAGDHAECCLVERLRGRGVPKVGGLYTYLVELYGRKTGFLYGWVEAVISSPGSAAALAIAFATFATYFRPMDDNQLKLTHPDHRDDIRSADPIHQVRNMDPVSFNPRQAGPGARHYCVWCAS
jgi:hypothetical protein